MKSFIPLCLLLASGLASAAPTAESETGLLDFEPSMNVRDMATEPDDYVPDATELPESAWTNNTAGNEPDDDSDDTGAGPQADATDSTDASGKGGKGHAVLHNRINKGFQYVLIGTQQQFPPNGVAKSGKVKPGHKVNMRYSPKGQPGYSLKLAYRNVESSQSVEQIEYAVDGGGKLSYDLSAINGDPFRKFQRSCVPSKRNQPGYFCKPIVCKAGSDGCGYTKGGTSNPVFSCPDHVNLNLYVGKKGKD